MLVEAVAFQVGTFYSVGRILLETFAAALSMRSAHLLTRRHKSALASFATALLVGAALYTVQEPTSTVSKEQARLVVESSKMDRAVIGAQSSRPVYRYSVVPGGMNDAAELKDIVRKDKVVAQHYAAFDITKIHNKTVKKARSVYVSYRKGDNIYWTKTKVKLALGETILSDGSLESRARCANRISDTPQFPVELKGPTSEELDTVTKGQAEDDGSPAVLPVAADNSETLLSGGASTHVGNSYVALNSEASNPLSNTLSGASSSTYAGLRMPTLENPIGNQSSYTKPATVNKTPLANESVPTNDSNKPSVSEKSSETTQDTSSQKPGDSTVGTATPSTPTKAEPAVNQSTPDPVPTKATTRPSVGDNVPGTRIDTPVESSLLPNTEITKPVGSDEISSPPKVVPSITLPQEASEIPEPGTLLLFGASLAGMLISRRRNLRG